MRHGFEARREEAAEERTGERWLRRAFLTGALVDAAAVIPLLVPAVSRLLWGVGPGDGIARLAARSSARSSG